MKYFSFLYMLCFLIISCQKDEPANVSSDFKNKIYCSNYDQGLYELDIETGESKLLVSYDYYEMYDPIFVSGENLIVIPGAMTNIKKGFVTIDLETFQIKEFENSECWQNFELNDKTGTIYCNNYEKGLYEVDIKTGNSIQVLAYNYYEMDKPVYERKTDKLVMPGALTSKNMGFVTIDLITFEIQEFENNDCGRRFVYNSNNGKIYGHNYDQGLYEVNTKTGESNLLKGYNYMELYQPIFIKANNSLIIPGYFSEGGERGYLKIDLQTFNIEEIENNICFKHFVVVDG
jgi:hypothetical protein